MNTNDALKLGAYWTERAAQSFATLARLADEAGMHGVAAYHRAQAADADAAVQTIHNAALAARLIQSKG